MPCAKCRKSPEAVFFVEGREICGECFERIYPERVPKFDQEAIKKRVMEKKWLRMIDLPGYKEWSAQHEGLDRISGDSTNYCILVHPDEFGESLDEKFAEIFQGWLNEYADRGAPRRNLDEYKKA